MCEFGDSVDYTGPHLKGERISCYLSLGAAPMDG